VVQSRVEVGTVAFCIELSHSGIRIIDQETDGYEDDLLELSNLLQIYWSDIASFHPHMLRPL
jgi:hypothetical protein